MGSTIRILYGKTLYCSHKHHYATPNECKKCGKFEAYDPKLGYVRCTAPKSQGGKCAGNVSRINRGKRIRADKKCVAPCAEKRLQENHPTTATAT